MQLLSESHDIHHSFNSTGNGRQTVAQRTKVDAELAVNSLALLGFNTDYYHDRYMGIAHELPPITIHSFDISNETLLLVALHFLLSLLDHHHFLEEIIGCWPYLDMPAKVKYKDAVMSSLEHLCSERILPPSIIVSSGFWAMNVSASGAEAWQLLRALTDACLDLIIEPNAAEHVAKRNHSSNFNAVSSSTRIDDVTSEQLLLDLSPAPRSMTAGDTSSWEVQLLLAAIDREVMNVADQVLERQQHEFEARQYLEELDARLKKAKKLSRRATRKLKKSARALDDEAALEAFSEEAMEERAQQMEKVINSTNLLKALDEADLIGKASDFLEMDKQQMQGQAIFLPSGLHSASAFMIDTESQFVSNEEITAAKKNLRGALDSLVEAIEDTINSYHDSYYQQVIEEGADSSASPSKANSPSKAAIIANRSPSATDAASTEYAAAVMSR